LRLKFACLFPQRGTRNGLNGAALWSTFESYGRLMAEPADRYRQYAAECLRIARDARDADHKARLLQMADDWRRLADAVDRPGGDKRLDAK
jgi:hypothetical protein